MGPLPQPMGKKLLNALSKGVLGGPFSLPTALGGAGPVAEKRVEETRVGLRIVSKYQIKGVEETKRNNGNQGTKRGRKRQSGAERKISKRKIGFLNDQALFCNLRTVANEDYGICSFTRPSVGRWQQ